MAFQLSPRATLQLERDFHAVKGWLHARWQVPHERLVVHIDVQIGQDRPARFVVLSARVGSIGDNALGGWYSYRAAKAALNQLIHTAAIEIARSHREAVVVCLHPGTVETRFTRDYSAGHSTVAPDTAAANLLAVLDGLTPADTGGFFDWAGVRIPW